MPSVPDLLRQLDEAVSRAVGIAAGDATARLAPERVYGFVILHYAFWNCHVGVFTEAQYDRSILVSAGRPRDVSQNEFDRWNPIDYGHGFFRDDLFAPIDDLFLALEGKEQEEEVARIFIRALRRVRADIFTDPRVVLGVMDYTEGPSVPFYAFAERLNEPAALARLKAQIRPGPDWDYLDLQRTRVPEA